MAARLGASGLPLSFHPLLVKDWWLERVAKVVEGEEKVGRKVDAIRTAGYRGGKDSGSEAWSRGVVCSNGKICYGWNLLDTAVGSLSSCSREERGEERDASLGGSFCPSFASEEWS